MVFKGFAAFAAITSHGEEQNDRICAFKMERSDIIQLDSRNKFGNSNYEDIAV